MHIISIRQPWALLVCAGAKSIENRTWSTGHRGKLAIHTGMYAKAVEKHARQFRELFAFGAIIGTVELKNVVPVKNVRSEDWAEGPHCFLLDNPKLFSQPIPHKGRVGISTLCDDLSQLVVEHENDCVDPNRNSDYQKLFQLIAPAPIEKSLLRRTD